MSVLKGAAATALYGSRGINGAVVITTKSGKSGSNNFGVSFSQVTGIETVYRTPDFQNEFGAGLPVGWSSVSYPNQTDGTTNRWDPSYGKLELYEGQWVPTLRDASTLTFGPKISDTRKLWNGNVIDHDGEVVNHQAYPDNMKDTYDTGFNTKTSLSISGGTEKASFYLSNTYQHRTGTYSGNTFELNSTLLKGSYQVSEKFRVEASIALSTSTGQNPPRNTGRGFWWGDTDREYNTKKFRELYQTDHGGKPNTAFGDQYGAVPSVGLWWDMNNNLYQQKTTLITPIIRMNYKINDWASFIGEVNMNMNNNKNEDKVMGDGYNRDGGSYSISLSENVQRSAKASFNFNKRFGDFGTSLIVGGEWWRTRGTGLSQYTVGGLIVPGQFFIGNSKNPVIGNGHSIESQKNIYSTYFLASFDYKEQIFLDVTGRNDWTTSLVYADARDGRSSYFYPSVSASWLFSETFETPTWMDFGKLRASVAQVGRDTDPYRINTSYGVSSYRYPSGTVYGASYSDVLVDPNLRGELKTSLEFGLDVRFLKNRIGLDVTFYKENTRNQIIGIPAPGQSGVKELLLNTGDIQNQGWEISLRTTPIRTADFEWDLDFLYTRNVNKIISLHESVGDYKSLRNDLGYGGMDIVANIGGFYGEVFTTNSAKLDPQGRRILQWEDNTRAAYYQTDGIRTSIGKIAPDFEASISTAFRYRNFSISALIDGRFGGYMTSLSSQYATNRGRSESSLQYRSSEYGGITFTSQYEDAKGITYEDGMIPDGAFYGAENAATGKREFLIITPGGGKQDVHGLTYQEAYDKGYVEPVHAGMWHKKNNDWKTAVISDTWSNNDVRYIALRQLSIGYTLPAKITKKLKLTNFHVSLDGHNLAYLYNNMPNGINPESGDGSGYNGYLEKSFAPYTATYSLAIRFNL